MKLKNISAALAMVSVAIGAYSQERYLHIYNDGGLQKSYKTASIDYMQFDESNGNLNLYRNGRCHTVGNYASIDSLRVGGEIPGFDYVDLDVVGERVIAELANTEMVFVEGGTFTMGATAEHGSAAWDSEKPAHEVTLSDYYIGKYEVTQELWEYVMTYSGPCADGTTMSAYSTDPWLGDEDPSSELGKGDAYPAYYVSYSDIVDIFLPRLNRITGKEYSLPTEAEWEYAARGGNKSQGYKCSGSDNMDDVAWYSGNSGDRTHEVGTKRANELGIYDMSGNVFEWCSDWYGSYSSAAQTNPTGPTSGYFRVIRGGSWFHHAGSCRVSYRANLDPDYGSDCFGFRLACRQL